MRKIVATAAPALRIEIAKYAAWAYVAILVVMAVTQLFSFEDFVPLLDDYMLPGGDGTTALVACVIVVAEIFAIPFLLRMKLSPLMRWVGMMFSLLVPLIWLKLALSVLSSGEELQNGGMLGAVTSSLDVSTTVQGVVALLLSVLAIYVAVGLWPNGRKKLIK